VKGFIGSGHDAADHVIYACPGRASPVCSISGLIELSGAILAEWFAIDRDHGGRLAGSAPMWNAKSGLPDLYL